MALEYPPTPLRQKLQLASDATLHLGLGLQGHGWDLADRGHGQGLGLGLGGHRLRLPGQAQGAWLGSAAMGLLWA